MTHCVLIFIELLVATPSFLAETSNKEDCQSGLGIFREKLIFPCPSESQGNLGRINQVLIVCICYAFDYRKHQTFLLRKIHEENNHARVHDYGSKIPENMIYFAHTVGGALILTIIQMSHCF